MVQRLLSWCRKGLWRLAAWLHHLDFALLLPALARLPLAWGYRLAALRGKFNALSGRDWRSMALGMRHIRRQSLAGYALLPLAANEAQRRAWRNERFVVEARDEFEARLVAAGRVRELACRSVDGAGGAFAGLPPQRPRGLLLLTPHFDSFFVGVAFAARGGARVNLMSSAVTHDPRVDAAVQQHFSAKYRGLEPWLNGGQVLDMEQGVRPFYRMLERGETLVVLGDAPVLPNGVSAQVDFLGARRLLAGGALRLAEKTGSDIGGYVCSMERPGQYVMEWCEPGPASDPHTVERVYELFSRAILATPGRWWGADLLPNLPAVATQPLPCPPGPANSAAPDYAVLLLNASPLAGTDELAFGLQALQQQWPGSVSPPGDWLIFRPEEAPAPAVLLPQVRARNLLVLLDPALLGTVSLPRELADALAQNDSLCALADEARFALGEWAPGYSTQVDFERYVARRGALPRCLPHGGRAQAAPKAYMLRLDRLQALPALPSAGWPELPAALGAGTVLAPRAFVHSYADYQQGARTEMLELLPAGVQRLLDVGGGEGGFARAFALQRRGEAVLVEPGPMAAQRARDSGLQVIESSIDGVDVAQHGQFQAVSFLDVLEHLDDPLAALRQARKLLVPGGLLLVSVPNVGYWPVVRDLMMGRFDYQPVGILCTTHIRFFTARSLEQLLQAAGFELVRLRRHGAPQDTEFTRFVQAADAAGLSCDQDNLATESLHALARAR